MRLYLKIAVLIAIVTLGVGATSALLAGRILHTSMIRELQDKSLIICQTTADHITHNVTQGETVITHEGLLDLQQRVKGLKYAYVVGFDGKIFTHTFDSGFPKALLDNHHQHVFESSPDTGTVLFEYQTLEGKAFIDQSLPLIKGLNAHLHIGLNVNHVYENITALRTQIMAWTFVIVFVGIAFGVIVSHRITLPLYSLADFMLTYGKGEGKDLVELNSGGLEINALTHAFQKMIKDRVLVDKALLESEKRLRSLINQAGDAFFLHSGEGKIIEVNKRTCDILGYSREELLSMRVYDIDPVARQFDHKEMYWDKMIPKQPITIEGIHQRKDGTTFPVEIRAVMVEMEGKKYFQGLARDVTERKQSEAELAAEKERLDVTLHSIGDGVITTDIFGNVVLLNRVAETLTGWSNEEAAGRPMEEVFHIFNEQTREVCDNPVTKVINSGQIVGLANHTVLLARDGRERSIADSGAPIFDAKRDIIGVVLVFRDVTEEQRIEQEVIKTRKLESVGVLAGGIAHDFNNILMAIMGNIELAEEYTDSTNKAYPLLQDAKKASIRAKDLTQQLLTFAKGGDPVKKTASIDTVITDSANFVLHGSSVGCIYKIPEDLWQVDVDTGQISQVIQNIIINARHAMPDGGVVKVSCKNSDANLSLREDKHIKITIADTGTGIPAKFIDKIFDPYFTTKGSSDEKGSGLGLAISHSIISKHGGSISVQSEAGEGSIFTICLPASLQCAQTSEGLKEDPVKAKRNATIMVMDDDSMIRNLAQIMLERFGHEVVLAENGHGAIELYNEYFKNDRPIDVIIMDLTIPGGMGGRDAVQEILRINPKAIVIVASGYSNDPVMAHYLDYGFKASISKLFQIGELNTLINSVLE